MKFHTTFSITSASYSLNIYGGSYSRFLFLSQGHPDQHWIAIMAIVQLGMRDTRELNGIAKDGRSAISKLCQVSD
jgi:hypothetical protein